MPSHRSTLCYVVLGLTAGLSSVQAVNLVLTPKIPASQCIQGCTLPLGLVLFGDMDMSVTSTTARQCGSPFYLKSVFACAEKYCSSDEVRAGWASLEASCVAMIGEDGVPSAEELEETADNDLQTVDCEVNKGKKFGKAILPTHSNFALARRTTYASDRQMIYGHAFGWALWILVGSMTLGGLVLRFLSYYARRFHSPPKVPRDRQQIPQTRLDTLRTKLRRHLTIPALFGYTHSRPAYGLFTIPKRLQAFWIGLYILLNVIFCCVGYDVFDGNFLYPSKNVQWCRYIANRTAIIGWYNLPLVWLLAGRNDFLLFLTGVSYSNLNMFHRWAARTFAVQAIIHSVCYTWINRARIHIVRDKLFWRAGVAATCLTVMTMMVAFLPIRKSAYEFFLVMHILIGVSLLVMLYYHVLVQQQRYDPWLWACIAIWCFDRTLRYIRLALLSFGTIKGRNAEAIITGADNGLIRLTVTTSVTVRPKAGQYYFLYHPRSITPWENHPFTLASWTREGGQTKLTFLIAVHGGGTRRLRSRIESGDSTMRVLVEGPYGHEQPLSLYDHLLFLAGGSGITAVLPYLDKFKRNPHIRTMAVMWSVKNNAYASDVLRRELADCEEVTIHVTNERRMSDVTMFEIVKVADQSNKEIMAASDKRSSMGSEDAINVVFGRPDFQRIVDSHTSRLRGAEKLAVVACGPAGMMDDLRKIMAGIYGEHEGQVRASQVDYFEQSFSW